MWCVHGFIRCLLGWEEDELRITCRPSYGYHSESESSVQRAPLLLSHNAPTRYESSWTTPSTTSFPCLRSQSNTQTTSTKQEKSSEAIQKPQVLSPSTLKTDSSSPKPLSYNYCVESQSSIREARLLYNYPTPHEYSRKTTSATSFPCLRSQSNTQTISTKPEKLSEAIQKAMVCSPSTLKPDSSSPKLPTQTTSTKTKESNEIVQKPKALSPSTLELDSSSPKRYVYFSTPTSYEDYRTTSATRFPCLRSQSNTQTTSMKPEKSSEAIQKPKVFYPLTLKPDSSSSKLPTQTTSTKTKKSSETVHKPKVLSSSTHKPDSSSPKPYRYSSTPTLSQAPFNPTMDQKKINYVLVNKGTTAPTYKVPEDVEALIKKDIMPRALKKLLSPSNYKDFFHTLLYDEDCYIEKWNGFEMKDVTLELDDAAIYKKKSKDKNLKRSSLKEEDDKVFVAFEMDSVPHRRPFLLSRDFASVRPSGSSGEPYQGIIFGVRRNRVLVEYGKDFLSQHYQDCKYDVKFSFNRICLKRAHQAIDSVSDNLFKNFLFPTSRPSSKVNMLTSQDNYMDWKLDKEQIIAVRKICSHHGPPPCLIEGPLCITDTKLSRTGILIREAILRTYITKPDARILICAPSNVTCDELVKSLRREIPVSDMFRANAAFREKDEVHFDILPSCRTSGECFSCPSLEELQKFKVVSSTYMSCFRLCREGLVAGHFSQMFMLDASSTTEPEALVALAHFAHESANVVVTGAWGNSSHWIRSPRAKDNGLKKSYFERLYDGGLYEDVCHL